LSACKARQHVKILPDSTEKDPKDTSDRVLNKLAWGLFYGTEGVLRSVYENMAAAGRSGNTWQIVNDGMYAPAGGETISRSMTGWLKTGSASAIILLLTSAKKLLTAHENCS
jgi:hypothetical protein